MLEAGNVRYYFSPNDRDMIAETDSQSIQNAVNAAHAAGINVVKIPKVNIRNGKMVWIIDKEIRLPSNMQVVLDNCHLRMADGCICNMFCNEYARTPVGNTAEGEQHDISIIGIGTAVLDGGEPNGLDEHSSEKDGMPHVKHNLTIYLHNVTRFRIEGLTVMDQRWWAFAFMYARDGIIRDIRFRLTRHSIDCKMPWRNQDGIDLRVGCSNIEITNIVGETGDDLIALTALSGSSFEIEEKVLDRSTNIEDICIHGVRGITSCCALIRLLAHCGHQIRRITIRDIYEISRPGIEAQSQMVVRIGDELVDYYANDLTLRAKLGDVSDITIENIYSRSLCAILTSVTIKNFVARNIHVRDDGGYAYACGSFQVEKDYFGTKIRIFHPSISEELSQLMSMPVPGFTTEIENVLVENIFYSGTGQKAKGVIGFNNTNMKNVTIRGIYNESQVPAISYFNLDETMINGFSAD